MQDLTKTKQATTPDRFFQPVLDALPEHIAVMDADSNIIYINKAWRSFADKNDLAAKGYGLGQRYLTIVENASGKHNEGSQKVAEQLKELLGGNLKKFSMEYPCHSPAEKRWFKVTFSQIWFENQLFAVASHENITEWWQINRKLRKKDDQLTAMLASIPDPICILDKSLNIVWYNEHAENMFGQDLGYKKCIKVYDGNPEKCRPCIVQETFSDGKPREKDYCHKDIKGRERVFQVRTSIMEHDDKCLPSKVMEILQDTTDQKNMIEQLKQAKNKAESATRAKTSFLATMSHEIRTPMNAILGMSRLLLDSSLDEKQYQYITNIHDAADALLAIICNILDLTKIEADKVELVEEEFQLGPMIEKIFDVLKYTAQEKEIHLIYEHHHPLPLNLIGDPVRISQILMNLISNALKYTMEGAVTVTSNICKDKNGQDRLAIDVKDTGIGIAEEQLSKIFRPFTQLDSSTTRKFAGTGLGLVIVKKMVSLMAGELKVQSRPGKGSTFSILLPIKQPALKALSHPWIEKLKHTQALICSENNYPTQFLKTNLEHLNVNTLETDSFQKTVGLLKTFSIGRHPLFVFADETMIEAIKNSAAFGMNDLKGGENIHIFFLRSVQAYEKNELTYTRFFNRHGIFFSSLDQVVTPMRFMKMLFKASQKKPLQPLGQTPSGFEKQPEHGSCLKSRKILVADDDPMNREIIAAFLEKKGAVVFEASSGHETLQMVRSEAFDLILMDIQMPDIDGNETSNISRELKTNGAAHVPIIAITGHAFKQFQDKSGRHGIDGCLEKPVRKETLYRAMDQWLCETHECDAAAKEDASPPIDAQACLEYVNQDRQLFGKMLKTFISSYGNFEAQFNDDLEQLNLKNISLQLHNLKSTARMICAGRLSRLSAKLWSRMKKIEAESTGENDQRAVRISVLTEKMPLIAKEVAQVINAAEELISSQDYSQEKSVSDVVPLIENKHVTDKLTAQLLTHIREHQPVESLAVLKKILLTPMSETDHKCFSNLMRWIDAYQFKKAEHYLKQNLINHKE
ncbi:ATP-binding protein [Desulfobacter latus]|uniref:Sensory/regulatory protein RpfC n=1 Tax=Desulfobacter latus TaxID=2292 RepID=A0A850TAN1_9BACT|nr:ATP-binding protein [Desulfobacter latus]NWH06662.1 response regulator [Desulfobacter latus]